MPKPVPILLDPAAISGVIELAWEDRVPFEAIERQFGLNEAAVVALMRAQLKPGSYRLWRRRVQGRKSKHAALPLSGAMSARAPSAVVAAKAAKAAAAAAALAPEPPWGQGDAASPEPQPCSVKADW